jgi:hypothetical protein
MQYSRALVLAIVLHLHPYCPLSRIRVTMYAMKTRAILVVVVGLIAGCSSILAQPKAGSPEAVVTALYRAHKSKTGDPFFNSKSRVLLDKYFVKTLADLIWRARSPLQKITRSA